MVAVVVAVLGLAVVQMPSADPPWGAALAVAVAPGAAPVGVQVDAMAAFASMQACAPGPVVAGLPIGALGAARPAQPQADPSLLILSTSPQAARGQGPRPRPRGDEGAPAQGPAAPAAALPVPPAASCEASPRASPSRGRAAPELAASPVSVRNTFVDFPVERSPSLDSFFEERRVRSSPTSPVSKGQQPNRFGMCSTPTDSAPPSPRAAE
ncbi:unnamed protein product, partial [Prorocentrum cordatum]